MPALHWMVQFLVINGGTLDGCLCDHHDGHGVTGVCVCFATFSCFYAYAEGSIGFLTKADQN